MNTIKQCKYGKMLFIDKDIWIGRSLDTYGEWAEGEIELLKTLIGPDDTVLDIGANVGTHTLAFSQFAGIVHSFEPVRLIYYILCGNIAINNLENVFCHQKAVGKVSGVISVPEIDTKLGDSFAGTVLHNYPNKNAKGMFKSNNQEVPIVRIDDLNLDNCHLIKADVEGMEVDVIKGALKTIEKHQPWLYLENDPHWFETSECNDLILSLGYKIQIHETNHFRINNFNNYPSDVFSGNISRNILCTPANKLSPI